MNLCNILHAGRKIITESEYVIKFLKYSVEVVNFDPFDSTNPKLGEKGPEFFQQIKLEA